MKTIFYWLYRLLKKTRKEDDPSVATFMVITFLQAWNIGVMYKITFNPRGVVTATKSFAVVVAIMLTIILMLINYFFLYRTRKADFIKIENQKQRKYRLGEILFWIYFIGSILSILGILLLPDIF